MTIRVFLLDDHELVRQGIRRVLDNEVDVELVGEADEPEAGLAAIGSLRPDVVVVDLMDSGSGLGMVRTIRTKLPDVACLVLTSHASDDVLLEAIRADVSGFLLKRTPARDLVRSLRIVASGGTLVDPGLTARLLDRVRVGHAPGPDAARLAELTRQERRLLDHLGEGLSNREIAQSMELAEKTIKNYVSSLLGKLGMRSRTEAAVFVTSVRLAAGNP